MKRLLVHAHTHAKRHFEVHYRARFQARAHLVLIIDGILVTAVLALLALGSYFAYFYHPLRETVSIEIRMPEDAAAGGFIEATVRVTNDGETALRDASLTLHVPSNILLDASDEVSFNRGLIEIGGMPAGASTEYRFRGLLVGPSGEQHVYAHLSAVDESGFVDEKIVAGTLRWTRNLFEAKYKEAAGPYLVRERVAQEIYLHNGSEIPLVDVSVQPRWPATFRVRYATPPLVKGRIFVGDMAPGASTMIEFVGEFTAQEPDAGLPVEIYARLGGADRLIASAEAESIEAVDLGLSASAVLTTSEGSVAPGEDLVVELRYAHDGDEALSNVTLTLPVDVNLVDMQESSDGGLGDEIAWDLGDLVPGARGSFTTTLRIRAPQERTLTNATLTVQPRLDFVFQKDGERHTGRSTAAATVVKIDGTATLRAVGRYFTPEGDQIGRGPLPPRVGRATAYWLSLSVETGSNPLKGGVVTARLPANVRWTGRTTATSGSLSSESGDLIWTLPSEIPAWAGSLSPIPGITFEVSLTPTDGQGGEAATLLEWANLRASDAWTASQLEASDGRVTTELPGDSGVQGRSKVQ